jgi:hypothetical protein
MITKLTVPDDCINIPHDISTLPIFVAVPGTFISHYPKKLLINFSDQRFDGRRRIRLNIVLAGRWRDLQWPDVGLF